jgi:hypothetical protein
VVNRKDVGEQAAWRPTGADPRQIAFILKELLKNPVQCSKDICLPTFDIIELEGE